jgi:hypothetical protein
MNWGLPDPDWLYTDWAPWAEAAGVALALAIIAWWADRRRMRRSDPDAVGLMPWRDLAFWGLFGALLLTLVAIRYALRGG